VGVGVDDLLERAPLGIRGHQDDGVARGRTGRRRVTRDQREHREGVFKDGKTSPDNVAKGHDLVG